MARTNVVWRFFVPEGAGPPALAQRTEKLFLEKWARLPPPRQAAAARLARAGEPKLDVLRALFGSEVYECAAVAFALGGGGGGGNSSGNSSGGNSGGGSGGGGGGNSSGNSSGGNSGGGSGVSVDGSNIHTVAKKTDEVTVSTSGIPIEYKEVDYELLLLQIYTP